MQRESPISILRTTLKTKGIPGLYSGCSALVVGNSIKAGVRFVSYDRYKGMLADSEVRLWLRFLRWQKLMHDPRGKLVPHVVSLVRNSSENAQVGPAHTLDPHSRPRSRDDRGHFRSYAVRND